MKSRLKTIITALLALALSVSLAPAPARADYTPPYDTVRIGIYSYKADGAPAQKAFSWSNLQNVAGYGDGYELGYYDSDRQFVSLGAFITSTDQISVLIDKNMKYNSSENSYSELSGSASGTVVGCFHLRYNTVYATYDEAAAKAAEYDGGFVKYENGSFAVLVGQYLSSGELSRAVGGDFTGDSGTANTVTVVETRTNRILFEFDCGTSLNLAVRPFSNSEIKTQTWHRGCMYYGGFSFLRGEAGITTVNYVNVEDYVKGVICYEMGNGWPIEALKAQAITARTYLMANINRHRSLGYDICNTTDCQAYHGTGSANANTDAAVDQTAGQYLMYNGELCETYYYSSNGGASEDVENVWTEAIPYLRGVVDPYEADAYKDGKINQYYWTVTYTPSSLGARLRSLGKNCSDIVKIRLEFTNVGNVKSITFIDTAGRNITVNKEKVRTYPSVRSCRYSVNGLGPANSANGTSYYVNNGTAIGETLPGLFAIGSSGVSELPADDIYAIRGTGTVDKVSAGSTANSGTVGVNAQGKFVFSGSGYGHNVGMSQWGAYSMAKYHNMTCEEILTFYYTGTQIVTAGTGTADDDWWFGALG